MNKRNILYAFILTITLLVIFSSYLARLYPAYANDDSPETIAASYTLGIAHPPEYPIITMLGKISTLLLPGSPAFRVNVMSAILALLALLSLYFTVKALFNKEDTITVFVTSLIAVLSLGFSDVFFSQAIEAKGTVYMLNLIFLSVTVMFCVNLMKNFTIKTANLMFFIYGLSLSNHWQSMIFLFPVVLTVYIISSVKAGKKNHLSAIVLFILGLTPYLFILLRAMGNPAINHGNPSTITELIRHILRLNYSGEFQPLSASIIEFQLNQFSAAIVDGFALLIIFTLPGIYYFAKQNKKTFILFLVSFIIVSLSVILFFRRAQDSACYYLPASYFAAIFIAMSAVLLLKHEKVIFRFIYTVVFAGFFALMVLFNTLKNDMRENFLSYDYCNNIMATMEKDSAYFAFSDFDTMSLYYQLYVDKKRPDLKIIRSTHLAFPWGIEQFKNSFPEVNIEMVPGKPGLNMIRAVAEFSKTSTVYGGYPFNVAELTKVRHIQTGLILKAEKNIKKTSPDFFSLYSYRGFNNFVYAAASTDNQILVSNYASAMNNYGAAYIISGNGQKAVKYLKKALTFHYNGPNCGLYTNLIKAYELTKDKEKATEYRKLADEECGK